MNVYCGNAIFLVGMQYMENGFKLLSGGARASTCQPLARGPARKV